MKKLLAALFGLVAAPAWASIIPVAPGQSIQQAVNVAGSGDIIQLSAGSYPGDVSFGRLRNVKIVGPPCSWVTLDEFAAGARSTCPARIDGHVFATPASGASGVTIQDVEIHSPRPGWELQSAGSKPYATNITLRHVKFTGYTSGSSEGIVQTADYPTGIVFDGLEFADGRADSTNVFTLQTVNDAVVADLRIAAAVRGHIIRSSSAGSGPGAEGFSILVRDGFAQDIPCIAIGDGDGCFQGYNSRYWIRNFRFKNVWPDDGSTYGVADVRRTNTGQRPAALRFTNNTVIGHSPNGFCDYTGIGDKLNRGVELNTSAIVDEFTVRDNIFECFGRTPTPDEKRGAAVRLRGCTPNMDVSFNWFWANLQDIANEGGCPASTIHDNISQRDPKLNPVTLAPMPGSPVCTAGSNGKAIGAVECGGVQPSPTPPPSPSPSPSASPSPQPSPSPSAPPSPAPSPSPSPSPSPQPSPSQSPSPVQGAKVKVTCPPGQSPVFSVDTVTCQ